MSTYIDNLVRAAKKAFYDGAPSEELPDEHWTKVVQAVLDECPPAPDPVDIEKVNHPNHYQRGRVEVAVAMDVLGHPSQWLGHALKYACRAPHKGSYEEDCRKAIWCARRALNLDAKWSEKRTEMRVILAEALVVGIPAPNEELRAFVSALCVDPSNVGRSGSALEKSL